MRDITLNDLNKFKTQKIGETPVVILPLDFFERIKEDMEMYRSKKLSKEIAKARNGKKIYTFDEVKKKLKIWGSIAHCSM